MGQGYIQAGAGQPVLMLHSSMSSKSQWKELIKQVSDNHLVIAVDLLGYGAAAKPSDPERYSLQDEIDNIDGILAEVGIEKDQKLQVIGHSFGGATALSWCYANPTRLQALHLFEPVAFHLLEAPCEGLDQITCVIENLHHHHGKGDLRTAGQAFIDYWSGPGTFDSFPPHIQDAMVAQVDKVLLDFQALVNEPRRIDDYSGFAFPITLIMGTQSPVASRMVSKKLKDALSHIDFHQINCGHMGPITHPQEVNTILNQALINTRLAQ